MGSSKASALEDIGDLVPSSSQTSASLTHGSFIKSDSEWDQVIHTGASADVIADIIADLVEKMETACDELSGKSTKFWEKLEDAEERARYLLAKRHRIRSKMEYMEDMVSYGVDDRSFFQEPDDLNYGITMLKLEEQFNNVRFLCHFQNCIV